MIGCIDVGGGLRDIYGAGIFDYMLEQGISPDYCIGVSAGSGNCASFVAKQHGRNRHFYLEYMMRHEAISLKKFIRTGSMLDLNYIYGTLSNTQGENPLDYTALSESETELCVVATSAESGKPVYFYKGRNMEKDNYKILMASSCLPVFCAPVKVDGKLYYDGGLSDPIPFDKAFEDGCSKVIVILTKPIDADLNKNRNALGAALLKSKYPNFSASMNSAAQLYQDQLTKLLELQRAGKALILAPDDISGLGTLTRDMEKLETLYGKGYADAEKIKDFLR